MGQFDPPMDRPILRRAQDEATGSIRAPLMLSLSKHEPVEARVGAANLSKRGGRRLILAAPAAGRYISARIGA